MFSQLHLHRKKFLLIFVLALAEPLAAILFGESKAWSDIQWVDVLGEGGSAVAVGVWMLLILGSRPAGRVTDLLTLGLGFMFLAMWQDSLDEFFHFPADQHWDKWLESAAMPLGISLLTYGLLHWHKEQLSINHQLRKRERVFRDHRLIDGLTQIGQAKYLKEQLNRLTTDQQLVLLMVDIDGFSDINRTYGHREGDALLNEVTELLLLNLRSDDLVCRYAGDRFAILLPNTSEARAHQIANELEVAVRSFAYKIKSTGDTRYQSISVGLAEWQGDSTRQQEAATSNTSEQLIRFANDALQAIKERKRLAGTA